MTVHKIISKSDNVFASWVLSVLTDNRRNTETEQKKKSQGGNEAAKQDEMWNLTSFLTLSVGVLSFYHVDSAGETAPLKQMWLQRANTSITQYFSSHISAVVWSFFWRTVRVSLKYCCWPQCVPATCDLWLLWLLCMSFSVLKPPSSLLPDGVMATSSQHALQWVCGASGPGGRVDSLFSSAALLQ